MQAPDCEHHGGWVCGRMTVNLVTRETRMKAILGHTESSKAELAYRNLSSKQNKTKLGIWSSSSVVKNDS